MICLTFPKAGVVLLCLVLHVMHCSDTTLILFLLHAIGSFVVKCVGVSNFHFEVSINARKQNYQRDVFKHIGLKFDL